MVSGIFTNFLARMQLAILVGDTVIFPAINFARSFSPKLKDFMVSIVKPLFFGKFLLILMQLFKFN